jgi:hypothetical protein
MMIRKKEKNPFGLPKQVLQFIKLPMLTVFIEMEFQA